MKYVPRLKLNHTIPYKTFSKNIQSCVEMMAVYIIYCITNIHCNIHNILLYVGASIINLTKIMLWFPKAIIFLVLHLEVVAKCCPNLILFHDDLYCCNKYSNVAYQDEIFKSYH